MKSSSLISALYRALSNLHKSTGAQFAAFSLVEMLMALLVASLLLAALAPVMTRRLGDNVNVNVNAGGTKSDYSRTFYEDFEWAVPNGVNVINVTSVGGGGAGGGATYGFKEVTSSESNWTVPAGVTKLRVFMVGAGGGGAGGGLNTDFDYANIPAINNAELQQTNAGTYVFTNIAAIPSTYTAPALTARCSDSGITQWTIASDNTTVNPNAKFGKFLNNITLNKVTACGAGGGGSTAPGGSGGYLVNNALNITAPASSITVKVGSPGGNGRYTGASISYALVVAGGAGGTGGTAGSAGARADCNGNSATACDASSSGGGGGSTAILNAGTMVFEAPGGGGGGGGGAISSFPCADTNAYGLSNGGGGNGGGSFNPNFGRGGGGGQAWCNGRGLIAGSGGSGYVAGANGAAGGNRANGGGGGGGIGGVGGGKGTLNSIFGTSKCNAGCSGAIKLWYSVASVANGLKCQYYAKSNSGGGGGAGQIWIGEISVTPGQKLNFNIGIGGEGTSSYGNNGYGRNGGDGGSTSISAGSSALISVSGGKGGKYESSDNETYINNTYGMGGGIKTTSATVGNNVIKYVNWKGSNFHTGGENGGSAKSYNNGGGGGGGKGGQLYNLNGILVKGGVEGGAQSNGGDALSSSYGAGGGGGGGIVNDGKRPGHGGKGANGYIYIEWGSTNGGGGASGQIANYNGVWVTPGTKVQITVGKGGEAPAISTAGNIQQGLKGNNGGDSFITTNEGKKAVAKGGEGGYAGSSSHGKGGNYDNSVTDSIKGEDGSDDYGGIGGTITPDICPLFDSLMGLGGCGGNMPNGNCNGAYSSGAGKNAGKTGGGGGGGAINNGTAYTGGKGANGMVVIEWNN